MQTVKVKQVKEVATAFVKKGYRLLFTGEPGSGKDYVAAKAMTKGSKGWCFFDQIGKEEGDKWIVKIPNDQLGKLAFVGTCSNMNDVEKQIIDVCGGKLCYLFVRPSPDFYKLTMAAKARDGLVNNLPKKWTDDWAKKAKWSTAQCRKHLLDKQRMYIEYVTIGFKAKYPDAKIDDLAIVIVENSPAPGTTVLHGWHKWDYQDVPAGVKSDEVVLEKVVSTNEKEAEDGK